MSLNELVESFAKKSFVFKAFKLHKNKKKKLSVEQHKSQRLLFIHMQYVELGKQVILGIKNIF